MNHQQDQHFDVASYALGVLDEIEAARFEDHLIECPACAVELESFLEVADILADVDAEALVAVEQERQDGLLLGKMIGSVQRERKAANSRRLYTLAAAVVVFAMLSIGALFAGGRWLAPEQQPNPQVLETRSPTQLDPLPRQGGPGFGGPDLPGERYGGTDARSGVRADVGLEAKDWGTQVSFLVSNLKGPLFCRLIAVRLDGTSEVLSTWRVGEKGWGTAANPELLALQAVTSLPRDQIAHIQVAAVENDGSNRVLVSVP